MPSLNNVDHNFARKYAKKLKYLTDAVMKHTDDAKDTRWLTIEWFEEFLKVDYKLSSTYLISQLLSRPNFWKLDYMFIDYIQFSKDIDPIILNFLFMLSPKNDHDDYIESFSDNINYIVSFDKDLAKKSLINILERDLNNSSNKLSSKTISKLNVLKNILNLSIPISEYKDNNSSFSNLKKDDIRDRLNKELFHNPYTLSEKTIEEVVELFNQKDELNQRDLTNIYFYLNENNEITAQKTILMSLIKTRFPRGDYHENLRLLINSLTIESSTRIVFLVNTFIYSKDGWYSQFTNKEALKDAIEIDKDETLNILSQCLLKTFSKLGYGSKSTANLIIALEYGGIEKDQVLSMYKVGFNFIEYRLPSQNDFKWKDIKKLNLINLDSDEIAIVMILSKMVNLDSIIQKEVLFTLNYIFNYKKELLVKPLKWFLQNLRFFPHISIASILEFLTIYVDVHKGFFETFKDDFKEAKKFGNLYIYNIVDELLESLADV